MYVSAALIMTLQYLLIWRLHARSYLTSTPRHPETGHVVLWQHRSYAAYRGVLDRYHANTFLLWSSNRCCRFWCILRARVNNRHAAHVIGKAGRWTVA